MTCQIFNIHFYDFRGMEKSHMYFRCIPKSDCNSGSWVLQSFHVPDMTLEFIGDLPIGFRTWELKNDNAHCNKQSGQKANLTFSQCYPNKFTCESGHCIPLEDRCNIVYDCKDQSDEKNCRKAHIKDDYVKEDLPVSETREPCTVYINISINSFSEISVKKLMFTVDFYMNLRWRDLRLEFVDLSNDFVKNRVSQMVLDKIWQPELVFANSLGPQNPVGSKTGTLIKEWMDGRKEDTSSGKECKY